MTRIPRFLLGLVFAYALDANATYVKNDPINHTDPLGLWAVQVGGAVSGLFPAMGGAVESGIAVSYDADNGLQLAGYQSAQARAGMGIFGGVSLNVSVTPAARSVADLAGVSFGGGIDTPIAGISRQYSTIGGRTAPTTTVGVGPGYIGDVYGAITYTHVSPHATFGGIQNRPNPGSLQCPAN